MMNKRLAEGPLYFPGLESNESSRFITTISTLTSRSTAFPCAARSGLCITGMGTLIAGGHGRESGGRRELCERYNFRTSSGPKWNSVIGENCHDKLFLN